MKAGLRFTSGGRHVLLRASVPLDDLAEKQDTSVEGATTVETDSLLTGQRGVVRFLAGSSKD